MHSSENSDVHLPHGTWWFLSRVDRILSRVPLKVLQVDLGTVPKRKATLGVLCCLNACLLKVPVTKCISGTGLL